MNIIKDFKNGILNRREIQIIVDSDSNPGFEKSKKDVSQHFKAEEDKIVIRSVRGNFGRKSFLVDAFIYGSKEDKERIEQKPKVKKDKAGGAK